MNSGIIHKLAVLGKDYYTIRTIDDLFLFAGADQVYQDPSQSHGSQRMDNFYGWVEGLKTRSPGKLDEVLHGVVSQMIESEAIPETDRNFLRRTIERPPAVAAAMPMPDSPVVPKDVEQLVEFLVTGLPRAMFPLRHRRKDRPCLTFSDEYDVQDLLHALLRPWVADIRPEEYTPSYAGSSTRMDFLLPKYGIVVEIKVVRDRNHGKSVGNELILDISHYQAHPNCQQLWCVVYDPSGYIQNPEGLKGDLDGTKKTNHKEMRVRLFVLTP